MPTTATPPTTAELPTWELHHRLARSLEWGDITPEQMAAELGVHVNSVHNYAAGRRIPKFAFVRVWAEVTRVPLEWLLDAVTGANTARYWCPDDDDFTESENDCYMLAA